MEKGAYVKDINTGAPVGGIFAIIQASLLQSRKGDPYWALKIQDASGVMDCKIWAPLSLKFQSFTEGAVARITGRGNLFNNQLQFDISDLLLLNEEEIADVNLAWLMPASPQNIDAMHEELLGLCREEFTYRPWAKLVGKIMAHEEYRKFFRIWPAAKTMHHAYAGGLLEHTLQVFKSCRQFSDLYPNLDRQTLLAGALFHDFGKIREFSGGIGNDYTTEGHLMGHIMLGVEMLSPFLAKSDLDEPLRQHLIHLILSHHGQLEFNAVCLPQTAEALALHAADDLDAKMERCRSLFGKFTQGESGWIPARETRLNRPMFQAARTPVDNLSGTRKNSPREECLSLLKV